MRTPVCVGVIGLGPWGEAVAHTLDDLTGADLRWICDERPEAATRLERHAPHVRVTTRPDTLLGDDDLDAVVLAMPAPVRADLVRRALDAGKHVLVQPPLAWRGDVADALLRAADQRGRRLMAGQLAPFRPGARRLKELIEAGRLGDLYYLYASRHRDDVTFGGAGVVWDLGAEAVATLVWLVGDEPIEVAARGGCFTGGAGADVALCHLRFATGIEGQIRLSRLEAHESGRLTAVGSEAMAVFDELDRVRPLTLYQRAGGHGEAAAPGDIVAPRVPAHEPLAIQCEHFLAAIRSPADPWADGREAASVVAVLEALERSLDSGGFPAPVGATPAWPAGPAGEGARVIPLPIRSA
jgi:predicted dehydrogenase